jgi:hypothetical protein
MQPTISADPPIATLADLAAALVAGGMDLSRALEVGASTQAADPTIVAIARRAKLGMTWHAALARSMDPAMLSLAAICRRSTEAGLPVQAALTRFATDLREQHRRTSMLEVRRAPVLLVLPLTLCFLPAFGLVILVPLLRAAGG